MTPSAMWREERSDLRDLWQSVEVFRFPLPAKREGASPVATAAEWFANDVDAFWARAFGDADLTFRPPTYRVFDQTISSRCGDLWPGIAALYCGLDAGVYLDERWISLHVLPEYGVTGVAYLIAHETAHSVQFQRDIFITSRRQELQADCLAGAYLQARVEAGVLQAGAVENLPSLIRRGGDDAVSNLIGTDSYLESHGTGQQRLTLFRRGYEVGIKGCGLELNGRD
ncbi:MAG TPA: neutral zinc metallopeptidase [Thermomicrobiales bacterium]|nr:neutral zinc metallopeptidase [Thermomicrobiales bacterium]